MTLYSLDLQRNRGVVGVAKLLTLGEQENNVILFNDTRKANNG